MRIITVEEHFQHPEVVARVEQLAGPPPVPPEALTGFLQAFSLDPDATGRLGGNRLAHMDRVGIDIQVVSHGNGSPSDLDHPDAVGLCRRVNDDLAAQIAENPHRFRGFATLPLVDPVAAGDELRRCVDELGFVGALISGSYRGLFLDDERFDPILTAAEAVDLPIYVHPGIPPGPVLAQYYAGTWPPAAQLMFAGPAFGWHAEAGLHIVRLILSGALDRHPRLKLLSGHWGELAAFYLERFDETLSLVPTGLERAPGDYYRQQVWITPSGMYNHNQLRFMTAELGADRILHSEDFPYLVREDVAEFLQQSGLSQTDIDAIAHRNAEALLRI
ncbi:amidohydrolase [Mycolicibacillus parakoreensis]|uniref:Amidohydrolase family protein n=1 Tax=Mycolicibacillus parakoreensis TaxID=1069221 RepID=A0ABY3U569_9MYCO|nr:amidohydrolase family protein [Mycolicibacillus parakoreensis]MCV7314171.1 amidohydrolase [Mycolicibacillus parakoreensis]ULN52891.1 amidohydrolase family protein [Mycolicibacillus parakoreensis]HLR98321.1 amidohydrolase family protein [Mycolicibacillus parakoreensis]